MEQQIFGEWTREIAVAIIVVGLVGIVAIVEYLRRRMEGPVDEKCVCGCGKAEERA